MKLTYLFLFAFSCFITNAQTKITGKIIEQETQKPLEFAEIALQSTDSPNLIGAITNYEGSFKIEAPIGKYNLQVIYVGQVLLEKELVVTTENIDLGNMKINSSQMLKEVTIVGKKKLIEQKVDRLIFNVVNSSKSSQGDVIEVLKITPGVRVNNDNISMIGKGSLQVMLDGKIIKLGGLDLINFLHSLASENIQRVEVISNPPAKYEASGNSGLINIVLKKAQNDSWNILLKGTYLQRIQPTFRSSAIFNFKKNRISISTRIGSNHQIINLKEDRFADFGDNRLNTLTPTNIKTAGYVATTDISYQVNKRWEIGGQYFYNGTLAEFDIDPSTISRDSNSGDMEETFRTDGEEAQDPKRHIVNLNSQLSLDSIGRSITLNLDYLSNYNPDSKNYNGIQKNKNLNAQYYRSINQNINSLKNYSAKIDVAYPLEDLDLDYGGKFSQTKSINDILSFNSGLSENPINEISLEKTNFLYNEKIMAIYFSSSKEFGNKWSAQFGLRLETTKIDSESRDLEFSRNDTYNNLFPTFYLSYRVNENSRFSFNYGRRIERPGFYLLNPAKFSRNPFETRIGNPSLEPSFVNNLEVSHVYKNLVSKFYFSSEKNLISEIPLPESSNNFTTYTFKNYLDRKKIGISENFTYDDIDWWTSNINWDVNYSYSKFDLEQNQDNKEGFNSFVSTNNDFSLNADKTVVAGLNYWYSFPGIDGIFKTKSSSSLDISLQFLILDKNLNITVRGSDIFKTAIQERTTNINGVYQKFKNYYDTRQLWIMLSYKFGNQNIKTRKHETGNEEERNRL